MTEHVISGTENDVAAARHDLIGRSREHLAEADMGYWPHLTHAFHQSNRLLVVVVKSYMHGLFPLWFKADGPKTIIRMYHEIRRIRHIDELAASMEADGQLAKRG